MPCPNPPPDHRHAQVLDYTSVSQTGSCNPQVGHDPICGSTLPNGQCNITKPFFEPPEATFRSCKFVGQTTALVPYWALPFSAKV